MGTSHTALVAARVASRVLAGLLSVIAGIAAALLLIAATGGPDVAAMLVVGICLLAGFLGLAITRTPVAPLRPARLALALSIPPTGLMLAGLPWPPRGAELGSFLVLALGLVLSGVVLLAGARWPRSAVGVLALLAAYGGFMLTRFGYHLVSASTEWGRMGPGITISYVVAASVAMAWITALWHSRPLWPAVRPANDRAA